MSKGEKLMVDGVVPTPYLALQELAAEGKFISIPVHLPETVVTHDWSIKLDGKKVTRWVSEAYAPGMPHCGWVVMFVEKKEGEFHTGETEVIYGNVEIIDNGEHSNEVKDNE